MPILRLLGVILIILYPFAVFFGLKIFEPKMLSLLLILLGIFHFLVKKEEYFKYQKAVTLTLISVLILLLSFSNNILFIKIYPFLINIILLCAFSFSLIKPPSVIERIARIYDKNLPQAAIKYTRNVTIIWCIFFAFNGLVSFYTAFFASVEIWTLYNGFISYILIGALFTIEYIFRHFFIAKRINNAAK